MCYFLFSLFSSGSPSYSALPSGAYVGNFLGYFILAFGLVVGFLVTYPKYQRETPPDEETVPLASSGAMRQFQSTDTAAEAEEAK